MADWNDDGIASVENGAAEQTVLSYATPARIDRPAKGPSHMYSRVVALLTAVLFLAAASTGDFWAFLVSFLGPASFFAIRMVEDGYRPVRPAIISGTLIGIAAVAVIMQVTVIACDVGHPQPRWRPAIFKPSVVAVPATLGAIVAYRQTTKRRR